MQPVCELVGGVHPEQQKDASVASPAVPMHPSGKFDIQNLQHCQESQKTDAEKEDSQQPHSSYMLILEQAEQGGEQEKNADGDHDFTTVA